jgi:hypothetical protein
MTDAVKLLDIALEALHAHKLLENAKVSHLAIGSALFANVPNNEADVAHVAFQAHISPWRLPK